MEVYEAGSDLAELEDLEDPDCSYALRAQIRNGDFSNVIGWDGKNHLGGRGGIPATRYLLVSSFVDGDEITATFLPYVPFFCWGI